MKTLKTLALCIAFAAPTLAATASQAQDTSKSLEDVMKGATAMTTLANAFLFVSGDAGEYICAIELQSNYFRSLAQGEAAKAGETQPASICVPATEFKNIGAK